MVSKTRFPSLWALLVGEDADAADRREAEAIRRKALEDLQVAQARRDTRRQHERARTAVAATCKALEVGA